MLFFLFASSVTHKNWNYQSKTTSTQIRADTYMAPGCLATPPGAAPGTPGMPGGHGTPGGRRPQTDFFIVDKTHTIDDTNALIRFVSTTHGSRLPNQLGPPGRTWLQHLVPDVSGGTNGIWRDERLIISGLQQSTHNLKECHNIP